MKIWIVTDGEYSDYEIKAVFSTEVVANKFKDAGGGDAIEEHEVDSWQEDQGQWDFSFDLATNEIVDEERTAHLEPASDSASARTWRDGDSIHIVVQTANRDRAVKIASERLARIKAAWPDAEAAARMPGVEYYYMAGFILDIAEVMAGLKPMPEPNGSIYSNSMRKALGL